MTTFHVTVWYEARNNFDDWHAESYLYTIMTDTADIACAVALQAFKSDAAFYVDAIIQIDIEQ